MYYMHMMYTCIKHVVLNMYYISNIYTCITYVKHVYYRCFTHVLKVYELHV